MKDFTFADETIDLNRSESYKLSIQAALNGFSFSLYDTVRNKYILLKHYDLSDKPSFEQKGEQIESFLSKDKYFQYPYKQVSALFSNPKSLLIPSPVFDEQSIKKYFEFNHPLEELEEIHYNYLDQIDAYNVFSIPNPITNALKKQFKNIQFLHHSFPLIFYYLNFIHSDKIHTGLNIYGGFVDILAVEKEKLLYFNSFDYQKNEDILYYVLNVFQQLNLDPSGNDLNVTGSNFQTDSLLKELKQFIKKVDLVKPPREFTYSYLFKKEMTHYFSNLFRVNLCV